MAAYLECLPAAASAASSMPLPFGVPTVILSAQNATEEELHERDGWLASSGQGEHIRVADSAHWIQLEKPDLVAAAIRSLWEQAHRLKYKNPQQPEPLRVFEKGLL